MAEFRSWQGMLDQSARLLMQRTGQDVPWWVTRAQAEGLTTEEQIRTWLTDQGVTGYAQNPVCWEIMGYPDFFRKDADELFDGQYRNRPQLRPIAEAILTQAIEIEGVAVQMRKTFVSLHSPRRKFAQISPANNTTVDLFLRLVSPASDALEEVKTRADDPFKHRVRIRSVAAVNNTVEGLLAQAFNENS